MSQIKKKESSAQQVCFLVGAGLAFAMTLWSIYADKTASAAVGVALTFGLLLFRIIPVVESFEILGLKAKLRKQLDEAEYLMQHLKLLGMTLSKLSYLELAWSNRMGGMSWGTKTQHLSEIDNLLESLNISKEEIYTAKKPYLNMISFDLYQIFKTVFYRAVRKYEADIDNKIMMISNKGPIDPKNQEYINLIQEKKNLTMKDHEFKDISTDPQLENISEVCGKMIDESSFSDDDKKKLRIISDEISGYSKKIWSDGGLTEGVIMFLEGNGRGNEQNKYNQIF